MAATITNIFVLMLENRSFDHMLGFSGITGRDAASGQPTTVAGPQAGASNTYQGTRYPAATPASDPMPVDPGHEFVDVVQQLCGAGVQYPSGGPYPPVNNSGFVSDYAVSPTASEGNAKDDFGAIMRCFTPAQLPVLNALARSFAVCDHWHASIPGPTWPNRMFACAASSGSLDHSPSSAEIITWETIDGFAFQHGSIFDALRQKSASGWQIFAGDNLPMTAALKGISLSEIKPYAQFAATVSGAEYPWMLTWIEPNYGDVVLSTFRGGNSQHPLDGVTQGEALIKATYEAIRNSPHWNTSLLIVTWDEHGGFYDHVAPPATTPPGDTPQLEGQNKYGFTFDRLGIRVPAVIVSPLIPAGTIDHRVYDHSSIPATVEKVFGLPPLTARDAAANDVMPLLSLDTAREDAPLALPDPAPPASAAVAQSTAAPTDSADHGNLPGFLHVALHQVTAGMSDAQKQLELARVQAIQTRADAAQYLADVEARIPPSQTTG